MQRITLIEPNVAHTEQLLEYKRTFKALNLQIHGGSGLDRFSDNELSRWFDYLQAPPGTNWFGYDTIRDSTFIAWHTKQNQMIGIINIRYELTDYLRQFGGHIGYSIHPDFWNQGYGTEILSLALQEADKLGLNKLLITCDKANPASAKVIINNGGVFENEVWNKDHWVQRYWITLQ